MDKQQENKKQDIEKMWRTLEQEYRAPKDADLIHLSGLAEEDIQRLSKVWPQLSLEERRDLIQALASLSESDFEADFNAVFRLALQDKDAAIRKTAIESLWEDEDVRLIPELSYFLREDEFEEVRTAAAQCLAHFVLLGETRKIRPRPFKNACQALLNAYHNPEETVEVRRRALEALSYASSSEIIDLIQKAYTLPEELMRISAVFAMGRSADRRWGKIVTQELQSPNPAMRYEAVRACGELEMRNALPEIIELVEDVDIEVQEAALWALGQIGSNQARRTLARYAQADNQTLREAAIDALNELEFFHGSLDNFFAPPDMYSTDTEASEWEEN